MVHIGKYNSYTEGVLQEESTNDDFKGHEKCITIRLTFYICCAKVKSRDRGNETIIFSNETKTYSLHHCQDAVSKLLSNWTGAN